MSSLEFDNKTIYAQLRPSDEEPINNEIKDHLSMSLNDDWKKFAYHILEDADIQRLDIDNATAYEKCFAMLTLWNTKSEIPISKAIVKLKLNELNRRDLLIDLAQAIPTFGMIHFPDDDAKRNIPNIPVRTQAEVSDKKTAMIVLDLKLRHIDQLSPKLDITYGAGISNWKSLAYELIGKDPNLIVEYQDLELHHFGGGNPALNFLRRLSMSHPTVTVRDFRDKAKDFVRNDIVSYINDELASSLDTFLRDIKQAHIQRLASFLNLRVPTVPNWEVFAEEYGYKFNEVTQIKAVIREGRSFSPTKKLFELLRETRPTMTIETIRVACKKLGRNDVVLVLDEIEHGR